MPISSITKNLDYTWCNTGRFTNDTEGNWSYITTKDSQISFCLVYKQEKDKLVAS